MHSNGKKPILPFVPNVLRQVLLCEGLINSIKNQAQLKCAHWHAVSTLAFFCGRLFLDKAAFVFGLQANELIEGTV